MVLIKIQNLKCGGCANTITNKLNEIKGISEVTIDVDASTVAFSHKTVEDLETAKLKLATIGYPEVGAKNSVVSKAKSYVSCATGKMNS